MSTISEDVSTVPRGDEGAEDAGVVKGGVRLEMTLAASEKAVDVGLFRDNGIIGGKGNVTSVS